MSRIRRLASLAATTTLALLLASACGGQSFTGNNSDEQPGDPAGSPGTGGTSAGGSKTQGGSHAGGGKAQAGSAGTSSAGTASGGGSSGDAGATSGGTGQGTGGGVISAGAGSGGSSTGDEACRAPAVTGNCDAYFPAWYHDASIGVCKPFVYGGCSGNKNRYESLEACQKACHGGSPNYDACKVPSDCVVAGPGCCGVCDSPNVTAHDLISYNRQNAGGILTCVGIACGACPPSQGQGTLQNFVPACVNGECAVQDLRTSNVAACKSAADCTVRNGSGCCPSCDAAAPIAVRNDGSFEALVCGAEQPPCAFCPPPPGAVAVCTAGRCAVAYLAATDAP